MRRLRLLDLYCCAGGASMGYHRAGFEVVGVDITPQPRYPFEFHQANALDYLAERGHEFDAVAASPPCHDHTSLASLSGANGTGWLLASTRAALVALGTPWIIENVEGAPMRADVILCGHMFGLRTRRHRWFEMGPNLPFVPQPPPHVHRPGVRTATSRRRERWAAGWDVSITGDVGVYVGPEAMGIDWMTGAELSQAIPPAYTEWIGRQLLEHLATAATPVTTGGSS
jgi:DNA (cytosine-5)-methyltransferase 1